MITREAIQRLLVTLDDINERITAMRCELAALMLHVHDARRQTWACQWLRDTLTQRGTWVPVADILDLAAAAGISRATTWSAAAMLGVRRRRSATGQAEWGWPDCVPDVRQWLASVVPDDAPIPVSELRRVAVAAGWRWRDVTATLRRGGYVRRRRQGQWFVAR